MRLEYAPELVISSVLKNIDAPLDIDENVLPVILPVISAPELDLIVWY